MLQESFGNYKEAIHNEQSEPSKTISMSIESINENQALLGFISDYLMREGYTETVKSLYKEKESKHQYRDRELIPLKDLSLLTNLVNELRGGSKSKNGNEEGILIEWWKVFWRILTETKNIKNEKLKLSTERESILNSDLVETGINIKRNKSIVKENLILSSSNSSSIFKNSKLKTTKNKNKLKNNQETSSDTNDPLSKTDYLKLKPKQDQLDTLRIHQNHNIKLLNDDNNSFTNTNVLGVIDQVSQPIDSRQLLLLRQSLFQEYLKKQSQSTISINTISSPFFNNTNSAYIDSKSKSSIYSSINSDHISDCENGSYTSNNVQIKRKRKREREADHVVNEDKDISDTIDISVDIPVNNFGFDFDLKDELNFNDFMNEYFI